TPVMLVPPRKRGGSRCGVMDHASAHTVPRPEPILTQEIQWDQEVHDDPAGRKSGGADRCALCEAPAPSHRRRSGALCVEMGLIGHARWTGQMSEQCSGSVGPSAGRSLSRLCDELTASSSAAGGPGSPGTSVEKAISAISVKEF